MLTAALYVEDKRCKLISTNYRQLRFQTGHLLRYPLTLLLNYPHPNKNILMMVDHVTSWPMVKAIPDKEATTVANAIYDKLILEHGNTEMFV